MLISLDEIITSISRIGDKVTELDHDGRWRSNNSIWSELADDLACRLSIKNTICIRKYIYSTWKRKSSTLRSRFISHKLDKKTTTNLQPLFSVPSYQKICTRSKCKTSSNTNCGIGEPQKRLIEFSYEEWRCMYKKDNNSHCMDKSWTDAFYDKLVDYKLVTCSLVFIKSILRKKDSRKYNTSLFQCYGRCPYPGCTLTVYMFMAKPIVVGHNVSFWVQIEGTQQHTDQSISIGRPMKGIRRKKMAKAAMDHGILKTYENNLLNADENLLRCNNYTQVPSMDVLKTAVKEQANSMRLDADMFTEIKILLLSMFESDTTSKIENKEQIYELIGCIVCIFGSPELDNAEEYLDNVIKAAGDFNSDFETFIEDENISDTQRLIEQELSTLDDNFLSTEPILHQSPFTKLACERSPVLLTLIDKSKLPNEKDIKNSFFSKELIKVFYKWIAYVPLFTGLMHRFYERYASDLNDDTKSKVFGYGRVSNATIESFFKIIKHSILRHQTNVRPADFLLKLYSTTSARLKANMHNIQQTGSKRRGRSKKKEVDTTILTEKWKNKGTATSNRGVYFNKFVESMLTASDIRSRLKEKLEMRRNQPDGCEKTGDMTTTGTTNPTFDDILIENVETQEFFEPSQENLNEQNKPLSPIDYHTTEQNISVNSQSIKSTKLFTKNININESAQTTSITSNIAKKKLPKVEEFDLPIGWPKYTMVGDLRLPFPHFNIGPTWFEGKRYSASNTCALDSSLFLLYYIYMSHSEDFRSLFDPNILICEQLRKTFDLVNAQGWDIARLYWISTHSTHANQNDTSQHHDLYATADNNVFQYVRDLQKYAIKSTCRSKDCPKIERLNYSVDIAMPPLSGRNCSSMKLTNFSTEYITNCSATIGPIEPTSYNGSYSQDDFFPERDGNGIRTMFICDSGRVAEPHQFVYKSPPVLLLNVGQIKFDIGKNETIVPTVKHLPFLIIIGKQRYCLAGAMCPKAGHFTATIVREKGRFSKYDDRCKVGIKNNEGGDDLVETAIYTIEMNNS
ncbi:unnamed protein product [Rotaria magnacalcarata]|uniref:Uncharacterized protein n=2 Tax=Rotaria magnacalcarata TaxID=392030 RepID=A0A8S2MIE7_9BILA|nr:unnamed protein product [Rotaria magnacalcarata]